MGLTTDHAFSLAIQECRAWIVSTLELALLERPLLLKIWVWLSWPGQPKHIFPNGEEPPTDTEREPIKRGRGL